MSCKEVFKIEDVGSAEYRWMYIGPSATHNYLCAVCREYSAVLELWHGMLQPCWSCQKKGYKTIKLNWIDKLFKRGGPRKSTQSKLECD